MLSPKRSMVIVKDVERWLITLPQAQSRKHIFIALFSTTKAFTQNIFWISIYALTWSAVASPMHLMSMSRQKLIESKHFQFWAALGVKASEACLTTLETSAADQHWMYSSHPFPPTCGVVYSSSHFCCKLRIKRINHSVNVCKCIIATPFTCFSATTFCSTIVSKSQ